MKCEKVQKNLSAYIDGEVSSRLRQRMVMHLARCPRCAAERDAIQKVAAAAKSSVRAWAFDRESPQDLRAGVMHRLQQSPARRVVVLPVGRLVGGALAGLVAAFSLGILLQSSFSSQGQPLRNEIAERRAALKATTKKWERVKKDLASARATLSLVEERLRFAQRRIDEGTPLASRAPRDERSAWRPVLSSLQMPGARALLENGVF